VFFLRFLLPLVRSSLFTFFYGAGCSPPSAVALAVIPYIISFSLRRLFYFLSPHRGGPAVADRSFLSRESGISSLATLPRSIPRYSFMRHFSVASERALKDFAVLVSDIKHSPWESTFHAQVPSIRAPTMRARACASRDLYAITPTYAPSGTRAFMRARNRARAIAMRIYREPGRRFRRSRAD